MPQAPPARSREWGWLGLALASVAALLWTCRRALVGTPAADTYDYLYWMHFHRPLSFFDAFGGSPYWRPVGRQFYYGMLGPLMFRAPWMVAGIHLLLLATLASSLYRCARHAFTPPVSAAIAAFVILSEPARTLLAWPTGAEPLLALVLAVLAVEWTLREKPWWASAAALASALSYEQGLLVWPAIALLVLLRSQPGAKRRRWVAPALVTVGLYLLGHLVAARSGAGWFRHSLASEGPIHWRLPLGDAVRTQLNLSELSPKARMWMSAAYAVILGCCGALLVGRNSRTRLAPLAVLLLGGAAWWVGGTLIAGFGSPGWYPWRTVLPMIGLSVLMIGGVGALSGWLAGALVTAKLVALLLAPVVPAGVEGQLPPASSSHSFIRIARLQRVLDSGRHALLGVVPPLRRGAAVRYWSLPEMAEWGFDAGRAPRVWLRDSTLTWGWLADPAERSDAVLAFNPGAADPAVLLEPVSLAAFAGAVRASSAGQPRQADSLLELALRRQRRPAAAYQCVIANGQARVAFERGLTARADSMNQLSRRLGGETPEYLEMAAMLARLHGPSAASGKATWRGPAAEPTPIDRRP